MTLTRAAVTSPSPVSQGVGRLHTFLFADLAGFTALTEAHGDDIAADLVGDFAARVRTWLPAFASGQIKPGGDALMLRLDSPRCRNDVGQSSDVVASHVKADRRWPVSAAEIERAQPTGGPPSKSTSMRRKRATAATTTPKAWVRVRAAVGGQVSSRQVRRLLSPRRGRASAASSAPTLRPGG